MVAASQVSTHNRGLHRASLQTYLGALWSALPSGVPACCWAASLPVPLCLGLHAAGSETDCLGPQGAQPVAQSPPGRWEGTWSLWPHPDSTSAAKAQGCPPTPQGPLLLSFLITPNPWQPLICSSPL